MSPLDRGLHLGQRDAARGGDVADARGHAGRERMKQVFDGVGPLSAPTSTAG